jgi:type VI secretion system protein ImpK
MAPSAQVRRAENLALLYQEVFTAIVRVRANRQPVTDPQAFRHHMREALRSAANQGIAAGYNAEDVRLATFAAVAFLDESVLNSQAALAADWRRQPLQEELFGRAIAGNVFFQNLEQLLRRSDSADLADLLEIYYLCMLLGFGGRYSAGNQGELKQAMGLTAEKIRRIRGPLAPLALNWMPSAEKLESPRDPWVGRWGIAALLCAVLMILLFVGYKTNLNNGISAVRDLPVPAGS